MDCADLRQKQPTNHFAISVRRFFVVETPFTFPLQTKKLLFQNIAIRFLVSFLDCETVGLHSSSIFGFDLTSHHILIESNKSNGTIVFVIWRVRRGQTPIAVSDFCATWIHPILLLRPLGTVSRPAFQIIWPDSHIASEVYVDVFLNHHVYRFETQ